MAETEIPWEFLVDAPDRRAKPRKDLFECYESCDRITDVENKVTLLANEFYTYKRVKAAEAKEALSERKELLEKLDCISTQLDKQKGFFAGAVWAGSAILGIVGTAIGVAISYFKG